MAAARCDFPPAGGPNRIRLAPFSSHPSPVQEGEDLCPGEGWHGVEVECVDGLARWQAGFEEMTLNSSAISLGDLMLNESGEQSCGWPGLLVGACGVLGPILLDGGEPEIVEDDGEALCVDHPDSVVHAASPVIRAL